MKLVVLGLSLSSSWGNGHATTYRALLRAFAARGHDILFLERDAAWYAAHRDMPKPAFCRLAFYRDITELSCWEQEIATADAVLVGSYLPEGVGVSRFVQQAASGITAFYDIDTPITLAKLSRDEEDYISASIVPLFDLYLSFTGGPTLTLIEESYGARAARKLYCSADTSLYKPLDLPQRWHLSYLGTYSADRQDSLENLLLAPARMMPDCRFAVAGSLYPDGMNWPANVERIAHVPPAEHAAFYAASRFTLNITRSDMIRAGFSPSVRLFEAGACGTPIISDVWEGIEDIFKPCEEILLASMPNDVVHILRNTSPVARQHMAQRVRMRVLQEHTAEHRAEELEEHLGSCRERGAYDVTRNSVRLGEL